MKALKEIGSFLYFAFWVSVVVLWLGTLMLVAERIAAALIHGKLL